jgi:hypothetical protein
MQIKLDYIPDGFRYTDIQKEINFNPDQIIQDEGICFVGKVNDFDVNDSFCLNHIHLQQKIHRLKPGDILPLILAYRRSMMEISSKINPYSLKSGDNVYMLGGDGYAGSYQCVLSSYGSPVSVKILGTITNLKNGKPYNIADFSLPIQSETINHKPVIIAVIGVRMDCGKSTTIRKIVSNLQEKNCSVVAGKVTGFGCLYETKNLNCDFTIDFTDFGIPSTCGYKGNQIFEIAEQILNYLKKQKSDVIILEFGGGLIGPYQVTEMMQYLKEQIDYTIFIAFDLCGLKGGIQHLKDINCKIDLVSGPIANTSLGVEMIKDYFQLPAESNLEKMSKTISNILKIINHNN